MWTAEDLEGHVQDIDGWPKPGPREHRALSERAWLCERGLP
ncbi:MAG: hypothetical protein ACE5JJ_12075 [Nitrospinota bacterium]